MKKRDSDATKMRILAAAVKHFGQHGYGGASLRNILADAEASPSLVNYHFGSKAKLLVATVEHYILQTHERRFQLLEDARRHPLTRPRLRALIKGYIRPHVEVCTGEGGEDYARLLHRIQMEQDPTVQAEIDRALLPVRRRFRDEVRMCCPKADELLLTKGIGFIVGVLALAPFETEPGSLAIRHIRREPVEVILDEAVGFAFGGFVELVGLGHD